MKQSIEELAALKPFDLLDPGEKEMVLAEMAQSSYDHLHRILSTASGLDGRLEAPALLKARLTARLQRPPARSIRVIRTWQAVAAMLALGVIWMAASRQTVPVVSVITQVRTDTLYRDRPVRVEHIEWRDRIVMVEKRDTLYLAKPAIAQQTMVDSNNVANEGRSLEDEPELAKFFVRMDR
jgi:hypothetical protein